jgi:hypothetical protein
MRLPITSSIAPWPITTTVPGLMQLSNLGESKVRELMRVGPLETVVIGGRRLIVVASYLRMVEAELAGPPKDARHNNAVPAPGSRFAPEDDHPRRPRGRPRKHPPTVAAG